MALQSSYTTKMGFVAPTAYTRITQFFGTKTGVRVTVETHYDLASRTANKQAIGTEVHNLPIANGATLAQMYAALKALPAFAGAIDQIGVNVTPAATN